MSDRRLEVFREVAKFLSFTKAAHALKMTQPAVTFQIRHLENRLNAKLFSRAHNRVVLTEEGIVVLECANSIFDKYAEMEKRVKLLQTKEAKVA
ncbi:MAG: LysR family transcriptional regulator [Cocleimonas sp.]